MSRHSRTTKRVIYLLVLTLVLLPFGLVSGAHMQMNSDLDRAEMMAANTMPHCQQQGETHLPEGQTANQAECCLNLAQTNPSEENCCGDPGSYSLSIPLSPLVSGLQHVDKDQSYTSDGRPFVPKPFIFPFLRPPLPISNT